MWEQSYEKSSAKQRNSFLFLPRRSKFTDLSVKISKKFGNSELFYVILQMLWQKNNLQQKNDSGPT